MNIHQFFRAIFLIGIILLFTSLFLEWYSYRVFDINNNLIASWNYNVVLEWSTDLSELNSLNMFFKPNNLQIPFAMHFIFVLLLFFNVYCILFKDIESVQLDNKAKVYIYIQLSLLIFIGFYIVVFPIGYLLPQKLYYLFAEYYDPKSNISYSYSLGYGYFLQLIALIMIFPYILYAFQTYLRFEKENSNLNDVVQNIIKNTQEPLNMDKFIAEEQIRLKSNIGW